MVPLDLVLRLEEGEVEQDGGAEQVGAVEGVGLRGEDHLRCKNMHAHLEDQLRAAGGIGVPWAGP